MRRRAIGGGRDGYVRRRRRRPHRAAGARGLGTLAGGDPRPRQRPPGGRRRLGRLLPPGVGAQGPPPGRPPPGPAPPRRGVHLGGHDDGRLDARLLVAAAAVHAAQRRVLHDRLHTPPRSGRARPAPATRRRVVPTDAGARVDRDPHARGRGAVHGSRRLAVRAGRLRVHPGRRGRPARAVLCDVDERATGARRAAAPAARRPAGPQRASPGAARRASTVLPPPPTDRSTGARRWRASASGTGGRRAVACGTCTWPPP